MLTLEDSLLSFAAVAFLLAANAFFVAAEFALVKLRGFRVDSLAETGGFAAKLTQRIHADLEAHLAACQLGITMASLGLGWVGEPAVAALLKPVLTPFGLSDAALHTVSFLIGFTIFSSLHIVVGEQVPKTYAIRKPEPVSFYCALPLRVFFFVFYPLNWLLNWASGRILSAMKVAEASHAEVLSDTELRDLVSTSAEHGELETDRAEMIDNLFRFDERAVERVMIPRVECQVLRLDQPEEAILKMMRESKHSRFPVVENATDSLVGVVLMKDLMGELLAGETKPWTKLRDHCREPLVIPETLKVHRLFETMRSEKAHMACVIDEYGSFVGLVTMEDLLEEIVGEIADETDGDTSDFPVVEHDFGWRAHGLAPLADVERVTGFIVDDELNANTVSGLFMNRLERIPRVGDAIDEGAYRFTVEAVTDHHVETVQIVKTELSEEPR